MSKIFFSVLVSGLLFISIGPDVAMAQKEGTWTGEVVDLVCYLKSGATGERNKDCSQNNAKNVQPMGLLTDDGTLVLIVAEPEHVEAYQKALAHIGRKVRITGALAEKDGMKAVILTDLLGSQ